LSKNPDVKQARVFDAFLGAPSLTTHKNIKHVLHLKLWRGNYVRKEKGGLAIKKAKRPVLAAREPQPSWNREFNRLLDTFRDEFGGYL
jgi:hypothetical protein